LISLPAELVLTGNESTITLAPPLRGAGESVEQSAKHGCERLELVVGDQVEEVAAHGLGMFWCRAFDRRSAGVGESHHRAPRIFRALLASDQAALLHPADVVGEATAVPTDLGTQLTGAEHAAGCLRQRHQHLVVSPRQAGAALELILQRGKEVPVHVEVRLPQLGLALVEPTRCRHARTVQLVDVSAQRRYIVDASAIWFHSDQELITVPAITVEDRFVLPAFPDPIPPPRGVQSGHHRRSLPFVMNTRGEIMRAVEDQEGGRLGVVPADQRRPGTTEPVLRPASSATPMNVTNEKEQTR
jgi:hypothetical protein